MREKLRIVLVEDHPMFREQLAHLINKEPDMSVSGEAEIPEARTVDEGRAGVGGPEGRSRKSGEAGQAQTGGPVGAARRAGDGGPEIAAEGTP